MANIASVIKRNRQSQKRRLRNQSIRTTVKGSIKALKAAVASKADGSPERSKEALKQAMRAIDKAASRGVLHKRAASRRIARLSRAAAKQA